MVQSWAEMIEMTGFLHSYFFVKNGKGIMGRQSSRNENGKRFLPYEVNNICPSAHWHEIFFKYIFFVQVRLFSMLLI